MDLYGIDLTSLSLADFRERIQGGDLLPSRQILLEEIEERFAILAEQGIENVAQLIHALKTKKRLQAFAEATHLDMEYLTILRREAMSLCPNPVYFRDIPGLPLEVVSRLAEVGIKHTKHFFVKGQTAADRAALAAETGLAESDMDQLAGMTDLARVGYMGPVFVRLVYDAGVHNAQALAACDPSDLLEALHALTDDRHLTTPMPILKDMVRCIENAKNLPPVMQGL